MLVQPSISIGSVNDTPPEHRPKQGIFSEEEQTYLKTFLNEFLAVTGDPSKKGDKKEWVKSHVYPKYIKKFDSNRLGGPNLASLLKISSYGLLV